MAKPKTMMIDDIEYIRASDARPDNSMFEGMNKDIAPWSIGTAYLIRTVTMYYTGRLEFVGEHELVLSDAAWISDVGRYNEALRTGKLNEVEPINGNVIIGRGGLIDAAQWGFDLPDSVK